MSLLNRRRLLLQKTNKILLPNAYQQVEYIESGTDTTRNPYILTNLSGEIYVTGKAQYNFARLGMVQILFGQSSGGARWFGLSDEQFLNGTYVYSVKPLDMIEFAMDYKFDGLNCTNEITINSETFSRTFTSGYPLGNLSLFDACNTTTNSWGANTAYAKIYEFKVYTDKTKSKILANLIPCYRKSDNVAGMYDTVNDIFYTNQGTGSFNVGGNV